MLARHSDCRFESELAKKNVLESELELVPVWQDLRVPTFVLGGIVGGLAVLSSMDFLPAALPLELLFLAGYLAIVFEEQVTKP